MGQPCLLDELEASLGYMRLSKKKKKQKTKYKQKKPLPINKQNSDSTLAKVLDDGGYAG